MCNCTTNCGCAAASLVKEGQPGKDGASAYVYIAYADDAAGTGFTNTFNASKKFIAIKATTAPLSPPIAADFAGLWAQYLP